MNAISTRAARSSARRSTARIRRPNGGGAAPEASDDGVRGGRGGVRLSHRQHEAIGRLASVSGAYSLKSTRCPLANQP